MSRRITLGNLTMDRDRYEVWVAERRIGLTFLEFELLFYLARNAERVATQEQLFRAVWHTQADRGDKRLAVHISRLRRKIAGSYPYTIRTVEKRGYAFRNGGELPAYVRDTVRLGASSSSESRCL